MRSGTTNRRQPNGMSTEREKAVSKHVASRVFCSLKQSKNMLTLPLLLFALQFCQFSDTRLSLSLFLSFSFSLFYYFFLHSHTFSTCLSNGGGFREYSLGSLREFSRISSCKNRRLCRAGQPSGVRALFCWHDPFSAFVTPYLPNGGATRPAFVHLGLERHIQARKLFAEDNTQTHRCSISTDISPYHQHFIQIVIRGLNTPKALLTHNTSYLLRVERNRTFVVYETDKSVTQKIRVFL